MAFGGSDFGGFGLGGFGGFGGFPNSVNRLGDPNVAAINAKLRARARAGISPSFPKQLFGRGTQLVPGGPTGLPSLGTAPGFGTPFQGARSPQDDFLKSFQKLRSVGQLPSAAQGLNSTGILNAFAGAGPRIAADPFGDEAIRKIGSKIASLQGLNTGIGLQPTGRRRSLFGSGFGF